MPDAQRHKKKKKNSSLELLRAVTKSLAHAVVPDDELADTVDDTLARVGSGLSSQYMGVDEKGEVKSALTANLARMWNADERRKKGLPREKRVLPGLITDTLSLPNLFGNGPEWSQRMQEQADATHDGVNESMDLEAPQGFLQHAATSGGMMLGQVPVLSQAKALKAKGLLENMKRFGKGVLTSPVEFMLPTIEPGLMNYGLGTLAGGALGTLGDEAEEPKNLEDLIAPNAIHRAKGGKVKAFDRVIDAVRSKFPKPGMFSVLDNLIEDAPFEKAPVDQWQAYLKPGREYMREDVRFPLRSDELKWSGEEFRGKLRNFEKYIPHPDYKTPVLTKAELLESLRKGRPTFKTTSYGGKENHLAVDEINAHDQDTVYGPLSHPVLIDVFTENKPLYDKWISTRSSGGDNYHEWATGIPSRDPATPDYDGGHDFPLDTISWSRIQDVYDTPSEKYTDDITGEDTIIPPQGKKVRLVDELQSDIHQAATFKLPGGKRLGYAPTERKRRQDVDIMDGMGEDLHEEAVKRFVQRYGKQPRMETRDADTIDDIVEELMDEYHVPSDGQPKEVPFMDDGWIRHELQKNLLAAVDEDAQGLAVIHPENIKSRYTENPGLGNFYGTQVVPELERLARRYGAKMGQSGKEVAPVKQEWQKAINTLRQIHVSDQMDENGLTNAAQMAMDTLNEYGFDPDNLPDRIFDPLNAISQRSVAALEYTPADLQKAIEGAYKTIELQTQLKHFDKTQVKNPTLELTPELRDKIKRIGVPLFSTVPGALMLGDEDEEGFAEGGKVKNVKDILKVFRGLVGGKDGIPEDALRGKARKGYASFGSSSPHVAASYGNPLYGHDSGAIAPMQVMAEEVIEFPVKKDGGFDKFEFDRQAQRLQPGQVLVARKVYDYGPRANPEVDPERLYSYPADVVAWNDGTEVKTNIGEGYAEGGKVGALQEALKMLSLDRRATARTKAKPPQDDPLPTVQEAVELLPPEEKTIAMQKLLSNDENEVLDALMALHSRIFPGKPTQDPTNFPKVPASPPPLPKPIEDGHGKMTQEEFDRIILKINKAKGGKIDIAQNLIRLFKEDHDLDITHKDFADLWNDDGTLNIEEALGELEAVLEGEWEVDEMMRSLGLDEDSDPMEVTRRIQDEVSKPKLGDLDEDE
jgi:hypothetical protein